MKKSFNRKPLRFVPFDWNALLLRFYLILCLFMAWRLPTPARARVNFTVLQPRAFISQRTRSPLPQQWRAFSWNYLLIRSARINKNNNNILQDVTITFNDTAWFRTIWIRLHLKYKVMLCYKCNWSTLQMLYPQDKFTNIKSMFHVAHNSKDFKKYFKTI